MKLYLYIIHAYTATEHCIQVYYHMNHVYIYIVSSSMCIVKHQLPSKAQRLRGAEAAA